MASPLPASTTPSPAIAPISLRHGYVTSDRSTSLPATLAELWQSREMLRMLVERDVKVRYRQAALGIGWAVLQPLMLMGVYWLVFGILLGGQRGFGSVPYPLALFAALMPFSYFESSMGRASNSLVQSANLLRKVYFPPAAAAADQRAQPAG